MSISTPAGNQRRPPSVVSTGGKAPGDKTTSGGNGTSGKAKASANKTSANKTSASKSTSTVKSGGRSPGGGKAGGGKGGGRPGGGGPRKPIKPVKVSQERDWGPIALFILVGVLAVGIIGYGTWAVYQDSQPWEERAASIDGIVNYRISDPEMVQQGNHQAGPLTYEVLPPVAGPHNDYWQNCMGDVYDAPIANEHAVHSMEHGAVWVTYRSDLPKDQVEVLAEKVRGNEFMLMSPVDNLDQAVSLQAWGYQLKVDDVNDGRIDDFIKTLRQRAGVEQGASCASGITATGTTPHDIAGGM